MQQVPLGGHLVRMSLSGHHITFRLWPSSRSFVTFMITTGSSALASPFPSPFPFASCSCICRRRRRRFDFCRLWRTTFTPLSGSEKNAVHKMKNLMGCACLSLFLSFQGEVVTPLRYQMAVVCPPTHRGIGQDLDGLSRPYAVLFCAFVQCQKCICQSLLSPFDT